MSASLLSRPGLHTASFYAALFMAMGVHVPFWPLWLSDWGLTAGEVGLYTALGIAVRVVAGLAVPALADRLGRQRHTLAVCGLLSILIFLAHLGIHHKATLLVATLAVGATMAGIGPIAEALGVAASRYWGFPYAQARGFGSMGFLGANLAGGALIAFAGIGVALWWIVLCLAAVVALVVHHPGGRRVQGQVPPGLREIGRVVTNPTFAVFMAVVAFIQASHAVLYAYGAIHWRALGVSETEIGALWAVSVAAEVAYLMTIGTAVTARLGPVGALALSGAGGVLRWGAMMADPAGLWLWPIQALHALTFAAGHLGAIAFISRAVPPRYSAAAQGATGAMAVGAAMAAGMMLAAALFPTLGGLTYVLGVVSSALGVGFSAWLARRWAGGEIAV